MSYGFTVVRLTYDLYYQKFSTSVFLPRNMTSRYSDILIRIYVYIYIYATLDPHHRLMDISKGFSLCKDISADIRLTDEMKLPN